MRLWVGDCDCPASKYKEIQSIMLSFSRFVECTECTEIEFYSKHIFKNI